MEELSKLSNGNFTPSQWVRCLGHVINLAVQAYLVEMKASVNAFRDKEHYLNFTSKNEVVVMENEDSAFVKVII